MYFQLANRKKNYVWLQRKWVHKTEIQQHYRYTKRMVTFLCNSFYWFLDQSKTLPLNLMNTNIMNYRRLLGKLKINSN